MKKKLLVILIAVSMLGLGLFQVIPALAATNPLDHIQLSPTSTTLAVGGTQQFTVEGYDANNQTTSGVTYFWLVVNDGGTISSTGLFTAGNVPGTYDNTVEVVAVQGSITKIAYASVTVTGTAGPLDHITITPAAAAVTTGGTQQFTAQGYDASNIAISGLTYTWSLSSTGIGSIDSNGLFTAGTNTGTFTNGIQVTAVQDTIVRTGTATVTISATPNTTTTTTPNLQVSGLLKLFNGFINSAGFENFLGGQWQVKNGTAIDTIKVIPGVVQTVSATSLTILPNGQTSPVTFTLTSATGIYPKDTQLANGDNVVVVTDNDQVSLVVNITNNTVTPNSSGTGQLPPGLSKKGNYDRGGKIIPPGWSHGGKVGWNGHETETESGD